MRVKDFDYDLPAELIAQHPVEPRDHSRLMVVNKEKGELFHALFKEIVDFFQPGDVLVVNKTKVIPARLFGVKEGTGAKIEILLLNRKETDTWEVLVKPGKRLKIGQRVIFGEGRLIGELLEILPDGNRIIKFLYQGLFENILDQLGQVPLPPYITEKLENQERYQTVYAKESGSAAAPTAGLHFTERLMDQIKAKGADIQEIVLHVGLGTFRPVKAENIEDHLMHTEYYQIGLQAAETINAAKARGSRIIAVGTTVSRSLEAAAVNGKVEAGASWTDIFIYPGYTFQIVDALITNFHFPRSTLLMLVSALAGQELMLKAYETAVREKYRFYSFGDAMFIC
ncbi:S-adenosylmethionine--tRNA ribosyltransferase-isomerase [Syntrophobotulus glycolicus DSM 8271]|uniref:S-adenosylmethionine:tRNA ribosyltransferase-isomerase n=1 Tax=Syntrophobotulus glycolicus (strain DSM 8271 / FlGlyR) TaxID=645991 RepID=F0T265_SYNGF|nr:tRNA preQ1(34) S-adenosylmethionine ribosyltransferase-isomerase QueA [Syntrophobotulus glycolicus]ADY56409.1 S-adenosylmethionine--tRNA ribosyltransferase-isomerase [Syntrophobotulus glycolicus DSM 8271]